MHRLRIILIEIPRVVRRAEVRHDRARGAAVIQRIPIDMAEPGVAAHGGGAAAHVAEPLGDVDGAEARDEVAGVGAHGRRVPHAALDDLLVDLQGILVPEGRLADEEFVDQDAEGPPVDGRAVARVADDLRREVLGRAAEGVGFAWKRCVSGRATAG